MRAGLKSLVAVIALSNAIVWTMNMSDLSNIIFKPHFNNDKRWAFDVLVERGIGTKAYDACAQTNILQTYAKTQDSLAMLLGYDADSTIGQLNTLIDAVDDGVRGNFVANAQLDLLYNASFALRYGFNNGFAIGLYLPVRSMRLADVQWIDRTQETTAADLRVKEFLTDDFFTNVHSLGGLNLNGWTRSGLGDLVVLTEWQRDFAQSKPLLKNVGLHARVGITLPTGLKRNEDLIYALPFGNDGAVSLLGSGGMDLTLGRYFRIGLNVALAQGFGNSSSRRIKTAVPQTNILLLQKACAYKSRGLAQQFTLYVEAINFFKGLSASAHYQFTKHGEGRFALETLAFSNAIANTATTLEESTMHSAILKLTYDTCGEANNRIHPRFSLFAQLPFNGKRSVMFQTIGASIGFDF